jgi:hypothetical protein
MNSPNCERYLDPEFGFSICPPPGWHFQSQATVAETRERVGIDEIKSARMPLFIATKYAETTEIVNPTIQIGFRPIPHPRPESWLRFQTFVNSQFEGIFEDYRVLLEPSSIVVGGLEAVMTRASFTVGYLDDEPLRVLARSFTVPRGDDMFQIGMSGPLEGDDICEREFDETLTSIEFV